MTVKELKQMLKGVPGHIRVYVDVGSALGGFHFQEACTCESGMANFGKPDESQGESGDTEQGFILLPHGSTISEEELDDEDGTVIPEMN